MVRPLLALLALTMLLAGCATVRQSRMNPMNWFGSSRSEAPTLGPISTEVDNRAVVPAISALSIDRTSTGAIVRAEALMPTQGWWDPELIAETRHPVDGVMTYRFVAAAPRTPMPAGNEQSRTLVAAVPLSEAQLEVIRRIVVNGSGNSRSVNR